MIAPSIPKAQVMACVNIQIVLDLQGSKIFGSKTLWFTQIDPPPKHRCAASLPPPPILIWNAFPNGGGGEKTSVAQFNPPPLNVTASWGCKDKVKNEWSTSEGTGRQEAHRSTEIWSGFDTENRSLKKKRECKLDWMAATLQ